MLDLKNSYIDEMDSAAIKVGGNVWYMPITLLAILIPCIMVGIPLYHTLVELFAIGIAVMSFVVAWNTYPLSRNPFLLFLGCGYLWVGVIDLAHTLTFADVGVIPNVRPDTTLQLWIVARYFEALILLVGPLALTKRFNPNLLLLGFSFFTGLALAAVAYNLVPQMLVPGKGLTSAKIYSEYIIIFLLFIAGINIYRLRAQILPYASKLLLISIGFTILAELSFTLYIGLKSMPIIIGHIFKLLSFWVIYRLLVESSLLRPIKSLSQVVHSYDATSDDTVIVDQNGYIQQANKVVRERLGNGVVNKHCHDVFHDQETPQTHCGICHAISQGKSVQGVEFETIPNHHWYEANLSAIHVSERFRAMIYTQRDITTRKTAELQFVRLNRLYKVLSHTNQAIARTSNQDELLQHICDIAVTQGEFKMSWIGVIDGLIVKPNFMAGEETGYLREMSMRIDDSDLAKGPVGRAAKTLQVACVNDVYLDADFKPWREAAIKRGYSALAAVPIISNNKVAGIFTLYSDQKNVFDAQMLSLLESLSADISAAIFNIRQAQQKAQADATIVKLSSAVEQSSNAVVIATVDGTIEYSNVGYTQMTGYSASEIIGQPMSLLERHWVNLDTFDKILTAMAQGENWQGEVQNRRRNGDLFWSLHTVSPIRNEAGQITHYVSTSTDNTELHDAQETIKQLAFYDPLTGLANRRLLMDRLDHVMLTSKRNDVMAAVILCDLDNFKNINDSLGHEYGDKLLQHVSSALTQAVRAVDTVARLGGDEFVLVLNGFDDIGSIIDIADSVLNQLANPIELSGNQVAVSSSIGIALYPQDGDNPATILRHADLAMYHAKDNGKNRFQFYQHEMNEKAQNRLTLENKLRAAIEQEAFILHYQPQVSLHDGKIVGFEALIRWIDGDNGMISPLDFIPLAEETGLIAPIGDWVIRQAIMDWSTLIEVGYTNTSMAVNVSAYQFRKEAHLNQVIHDTLSQHAACNPKHFTIELTESTLIEDIEDTAAALEHIKTLGIGVSIDDFGTGYSSLNYLKRLPIDQLKIDRSFVQDLTHDSNDQAIVAAIIAMAQKLELKIVAEGVEEAVQGESLLAQGCGYAQGFYYYKPMTLEQLKALEK